MPGNKPLVGRGSPLAVLTILDTIPAFYLGRNVLQHWWFAIAWGFFMHS